MLWNEIAGTLLHVTKGHNMAANIWIMPSSWSWQSKLPRAQIEIVITLKLKAGHVYSRFVAFILQNSFPSWLAHSAQLVGCPQDLNKNFDCSGELLNLPSSVCPSVHPFTSNNLKSFNHVLLAFMWRQYFFQVCTMLQELLTSWKSPLYYQGGEH